MFQKIQEHFLKSFLSSFLLFCDPFPSCYKMICNESIFQDSKIENILSLV